MEFFCSIHECAFVSLRVSERNRYTQFSEQTVTTLLPKSIMAANAFLFLQSRKLIHACEVRWNQNRKIILKCFDVINLVNAENNCSHSILVTKKTILDFNFHVSHSIQYGIDVWFLFIRRQFSLQSPSKLFN